MGTKLALTGINESSIWYSLWFFAIIVSALAADLFENVEAWILNSMTIVENKAVDKGERISMIKNQLDIAVNRYMMVFLQVNGFESLWKRLLIDSKRILKGAITVKELVIIVAYAIYDLIIRNGNLSLTEPYDALLVFAGIIALKTVDAKSGVAEIMAEMYKEASDFKDQDVLLNKISGYIKALAHIYHIETTVPINVAELSDVEIKNLLMEIKQHRIQ